FKSSTRLALSRAIRARDSLLQLEKSCRNERERVAWRDCVDLHESTIYYISKTLDSSRFEDSQTWLSAAMTNLETCTDGFVEFGIADGVVYDKISVDVRESISDLLAMNRMDRYGGKENRKRRGFPGWVSKGDRKLLQLTPKTAAEIVVAKDGTGNYTTVSAAVAAAGERIGSGRIVIYVKKGVYNENVNVGRNLVSVFLVGDGIEETILTGSRSNHGDFTTYGSATLG
ncbi:pectinesterase, partial [Genlisea aurea]